MYLTVALLSTLALTTASTTPNATLLFSNTSPSLDSIPSIYESTLAARRILHLANIATLSTVFPSGDNSSSNAPLPQENRPASVSGAAIGQMEYFAHCGPEAYNPTLLAVTITSTIKNAAAGSNVTLSLRWKVPASAPPSQDPWLYLPANLPRISIIGYLESLSPETVADEGVRDCFVGEHPEAAIWEPGSDVHESWWARLVVREVYFFGGFGDRARIGWLPVETWRAITSEEVDAYRLAGEEGYRPRGGEKGDL